MAAIGREARIRMPREGATSYIQVVGDPKEDWRLEISNDLTNWVKHASFGTVLSGTSNTAPWKLLSTPEAGGRFFRALKTGGLYDRALLRTISLTFTQGNWQAQLTSARAYSTSVYCSLLVMDNGATHAGVGARYRGNTSFTGFGGAAPPKKSLNLDIAFSNTNADLMGFSTVNLNNAYGDETILREPLYFNLMRQYTVCPAGAMTRVFINGTNWGVYSCAQQENGDLMKEYFPSNNGDRWRAPNMPSGGGPASGSSALGYLGNTNPASYRTFYELKSDFHSNALPRLINAIFVLNTTPTNELRDKLEQVLAVDRWLWFLALENIFADDDSYWNKGADYCLYYEPESGRLHPVEHDGNEAFMAGDVSLSPVQGANDPGRPVIRRLLGIPELRQRYLAHMRTVLKESYNPDAMTPLIQEYHALSIDAIIADPKRGYASMASYTNDLLALRRFVTNRHNYLVNHPELRPEPPEILAVYAPTSVVAAGSIPYLAARVTATGTNGLDSVWLYHRGKSFGAFVKTPMHDDGAHGDAAAGDGLFGAALTYYPAGSKVHFYIEARSANSAKAACFAPPRAEQETYSYRVALTTALGTPVVINEFMASNSRTLADPQGDFDDWVELRNVSDHEIDLTGHYLSDEPNNPRKWQFPAFTRIPADGYLLIWADEDGAASSGLHASFKLSGSGEQIYLNDTDANSNAVLDQVSFGAQTTDRSFGRTAADGDAWSAMTPTPGGANQ
jgi:hypothetical protein